MFASLTASLGLWRSPVAHLVHIEGARGSNPLSSTQVKGRFRSRDRPFLIRSVLRPDATVHPPHSDRALFAKDNAPVGAVR